MSSKKCTNQHQLLLKQQSQNGDNFFSNLNSSTASPPPGALLQNSTGKLSANNTPINTFMEQLAIYRAISMQNNYGMFINNSASVNHTPTTTNTYATLLQMAALAASSNSFKGIGNNNKRPLAVKKKEFQNGQEDKNDIINSLKDENVKSGTFFNSSLDNNFSSNLISSNNNDAGLFENVSSMRLLLQNQLLQVIKSDFVYW